MYILGLWDGHDCGAAIVKGNKVLAAVNEERFTKNKLEVSFPTNSVKWCLEYLKLKPTDIKHIAINTSDIAKTLTRAFPVIKKNYYLFRRRKVKPKFVNLRREFKYKVTELPKTALTDKLSKLYYKKKLTALGFKNFVLHLVEHHTAHAAAAAFASSFDEALVITLDGVGDALSGTVNLLKRGKLKRLSEIPAKASLGIFFEQATNLLGMRELEDEGKVMALSDYSYRVPDEKNPLLEIFKVEGLTIKTKYSSWQRYRLLQEVCWKTPMEDFAYMVQTTLERNALQLFKNAIKITGVTSVAWAGGVASNIKNNMKLRLQSGLKNWFVFPHMGDGGLALGSAMYVNYLLNRVTSYKFDNVYFGPDYTEEDIKMALDANKSWLRYSKVKDIAKKAAEKISRNEIVMWFHGRMEYGPRALGNRSILGSAYSAEVKNKLNVSLKRRDWFQPFCPSVLCEDARKLLEDVEQYDHFMTMGYMAKPEARELLKSVLNVDGSARPQMLGKENPLYRKLIEYVKAKTGYGIVLNTSFNIHGDPIVNTPDDALNAMKKGGAKYLAIGDYWVESKRT